MSLKSETAPEMPHWVPEGILHPAQIGADDAGSEVDTLNRQARKLKAARLRMQHPDWSEDQIAEEVRLIFLRGVLKN